mmetsp:Transcript_115104/g.245955  ORF Transcript_115104/g.245955 Transcript_115104/m.245955 type:complete len:213 (-) Transcript_115104:86-724(-)
MIWRMPSGGGRSRGSCPWGTRGRRPLATARGCPQGWSSRISRRRSSGVPPPCRPWRRDPSPLSRPPRSSSPSPGRPHARQPLPRPQRLRRAVVMQQGNGGLRVVPALKTPCPALGKPRPALGTLGPPRPALRPPRPTAPCHGRLRLPLPLPPLERTRLKRPSNRHRGRLRAHQRQPPRQSERRRGDNSSPSSNALSRRAPRRQRPLLGPCRR